MNCHKQSICTYTTCIHLNSACNPACQLLCLKMHNYYRALHNSPPMTCDPELAKSAQKWTDQQAKDGKMYHSPWTDKFTESISWKGWGWEGMNKTEGAIPGAVRSWYSEIKNDYDYQTGKGNPDKPIGYFQAVVWKGETKLGCGLNIKPNDGTYVTAHYAPPSHTSMDKEKLAPENIKPRRQPAPGCNIRSSKRVECFNGTASPSQKVPFVTPDLCIQKGCCYDDMFMSELDVWFYESSGRTWCFKKEEAEPGEGPTPQLTQQPTWTSTLPPNVEPTSVQTLPVQTRQPKSQSSAGPTSPARVSTRATLVPLEATTSPQGSTTVPRGSATVTPESAPVPSESVTVPTESATVPTESASVPPRLTIVPAESTTVPPGSTTVSPESTTVPPGSRTVPPESTTVPSWSTTVPPESTTVPPWSTTGSPESTTVPLESTTVPPESATVPTKSTTVPPGSTTVPPGSATVPLESATVPPEPATAPPGSATVLSGSTPAPAAGATTLSVGQPSDAGQSSGEATQVMTEFEKDCLRAHNEYRAKHGVPPLKWSAKLQADAQKWANYLATINTMEHDIKSVNNGFGENLAYFQPGDPSKMPTQCQGPKTPTCVQCREMVADWYAEESNFDYNTGESKGGVILHFTQVVWKETTELGMATATSANKWFIVARYKPRGNMGPPENFKKNVPRPIV